MNKKSTFGARPEQLNRLLSAIGLDKSNADEQNDQTASLETSAGRLNGQIGRYKLLRVLGEGGMGIVCLAEQERPIRRQVALKIIKPGMDSKRVIARFKVERQALALLDHPNIAHVHDAGTTESGRPYFVMEYVKGLPITEHCDHYKLTIEERLELFLQVCHAIHHAHQKGIIHRDIKPSNILVSQIDDQPIPKIIDFGVAKAVTQPLTEQTLFIKDSQLLGTPEYMSPEQADMATEDIDTRSDIYSLGVLLYVLLTGVLPFDSDTLREGGLDHVRKIIRETDPKTPSTRLTKLGDKARKVAERRSTEVGKLASRLHKELEWIPLKAMRKERSERYRSAFELADDIENYMKGNPLIAGPPSTIYRLKKYVRRNRALVTGLAAVFTVLIAGVVVSTIFAIRSERARAEAQLIADFLQNDVLGVADEARVGEATVGFMLDNASIKLPIWFKDKPLIEASIYRTLAETYRKLGEYDKAEEHFLHATQIYREHLGPEHSDTLGAEGALPYVYEKQGRYRDMKRLCTRILAIEQRRDRVPGQIFTRNGLGAAYLYVGEYEEAARVLEVALELEETWHEKEEKSLMISPYVKGNLARVYTAQGRYEEAERLFTKTEWKAVSFSYGLAGLYREQGRYSEAETLFKKHLEVLRQLRGDEHFQTVWCMDCFAKLYIDQDRYEEAETLLEEALSIARGRMRPNHPVTLDLVNARAVLHAKQKQYDQAEKIFDEALKGRRLELGYDHPDTLQTIYELAILYKEQGRYDEAEPLLVEAAEGRIQKLKLQHPHTKESIDNLIELYEAWSKPEKAEQWRAKLLLTEAEE